MIRVNSLHKIAHSFFLLIFVNAQGQVEYQPDNPMIYDLVERKLQGIESDFHSAIKPWRTLDIAKYLSKEDSGIVALKTRQGKGKLHFTPSTEQQFIYEYFGDTSNITYFTGIGGSLDYKISSKLFLSLNGYASILGANSANSYWIDSLKMYPQWAELQRNSVHYSFGQWQGYLTYAPNQIFTFEIGKGNHFYGNGVRSLWLTNELVPYPYFKISTKVWKIQYVNLFSGLKHLAREDGKIVQANKFTASHLLSWNVSKSVNVQLFETIIWRAKDSLSNRSLDVNYLNPIIFYRPVEFSLGSSDNAILGVGLNVKSAANWQMYGQMALDEFYLTELRNGYRWWGNKFGALVGAHFFNPFKLKNLAVQTEFILVRPFTYSHGDPQQNYAHFGQPLGHPLGANFYEFLVNFTWMKDRWRVQNRFSFSYYGRDPDGSNLGGDIFKSYVNPTFFYENFIAQGIKNRVFHNELKIQYLFNRVENIYAFATLAQWYNNVDGLTDFNYLGNIGISMNWPKHDFDFRAAPL